MIIIWGFRTREQRVGTGDFHCPGCRATRTYVHVRLRRWFTLYFVPLVPTKTVAEFVRCGACSQAWKMSVLEPAMVGA